MEIVFPFTVGWHAASNRVATMCFLCADSREEVEVIAKGIPITNIQENNLGPI